MTAPIDLTDEERRAIASLRRLAKRWPKSLWLFSASGTLHVMRKSPDGGRPELPDKSYSSSLGGTVTDVRFSITTIDIDNDGGDW